MFEAECYLKFEFYFYKKKTHFSEEILQKLFDAFSFQAKIKQSELFLL